MDPRHASYKNVSASVDDNDESSTEVDESLMGENDKQRWDTIDLDNTHSRRQSRRSRVLRVLRSYWWLVDSLLLLVILSLLILLRLDLKAKPAATWQVGGDFTKAGPIIPTKVVKWEADDSFTPEDPSAFFSNETLARWNTLMPVGTGWGNADQTFFTTSMTHQLHCLFMMGRIYSGLTINSTSRLPSDYHTHYLHCIDYLRQAIMCSGDVAVEAHEPSDVTDLGPLDGGWSGHHVCKDYGQVTGYLEQQIKDGVRMILPIDD